MKQIPLDKLQLNTIYVLDLSGYFLIICKEITNTYINMNTEYLFDTMYMQQLYDVTIKPDYNKLSVDLLKCGRYYKLNNWLAEYPLRIVK